MTLNSEMNAMMNETLNVSGALLVKLFGRIGDEVRRFSARAWRVRRAGHQAGVPHALVLPDCQPGERGGRGAGLLASAACW